CAGAAWTGFALLLASLLWRQNATFAKRLWCSLSLFLSVLFPPVWAIVSALNSTRLTTRLRIVLIALLIRPPRFSNCAAVREGSQVTKGNTESGIRRAAKWRLLRR